MFKRGFALLLVLGLAIALIVSVNADSTATREMYLTDAQMAGALGKCPCTDTEFYGDCGGSGTCSSCASGLCNSYRASGTSPEKCTGNGGGTCAESGEVVCTVLVICDSDKVNDSWCDGSPGSCESKTGSYCWQCSNGDGRYPSKLQNWVCNGAAPKIS